MVWRAGGSGDLVRKRRIKCLGSKRRIRWSGEQEEDHMEQEEDQVVWRAGEESYGAGG